MISQLFLILQMYCVPYSTLELNNTHSCAIFTNGITLFVGIMLIIDYDLEDAAEKAGQTYDTSGRSVISVIIFVLNLIPLGLPALLAAKRSGVIDKIYETFTGDRDILDNDVALQSFVDANGSQFQGGKPMFVSDIVEIVHVNTFVQIETQTNTGERLEAQNVTKELNETQGGTNLFDQSWPLQTKLNTYDDLYSIHPMYDSRSYNYLDFQDNYTTEHLSYSYNYLELQDNHTTEPPNLDFRLTDDHDLPPISH